MPMQPPPALKAGPFGTRGGVSLGPKPTDMKLPPPKAPRACASSTASASRRRRR